MTKPKKFPEQKQTQPGKEYKMQPKPEYIRKGHKGSEKLKNKVAIITGGDSGIGRAVAIHLAKEGADIAIVYLKEEKKDALKTQSLIEKENQKCLLIEGDVKSESFCKEAINKSIKELNKLNILVNNAA